MTVPTKPSFLARWARTLAGVTGANVTTPSSGQQDTGWTVGQQGVSSYENWKSQNVYDWLSQVALALPSAAGFLQGFEAGVPPTDQAGAWAAPSPRYGSDLAYQRDTVNPISGTASANRNSGQTANQNSSLGFDLFLLAPSRIAFVFDLLCNNSQGDHLDFFVDGVQVMKASTVANATVSAGRFVSDVLREGYHYFDWRFVRGASGSVASEKARVDLVGVTPESAWLDRANRTIIDDDFFGYNAGLVTNGIWAAVNSGNAGTMVGGNSTLLNITSASVAIGDWQALQVLTPSFFPGNSSGFPFAEALIGLATVVNCFAEFGFWDGTVNNGAAWVYDSAVGTDWRFKTTVGGVTTTNPSGIVPSGTQRLGVSGVGGLTNGNGWLGTINGQMIPAAGANHQGSTSNNPGSGLAIGPYIRVGSRVAAVGKALSLDYLRANCFRPGGTGLFA